MTDEEFTTIKIVFAEILSQLESYDDEIYNSLWLAFLGIDRETYDDPKTEKIRAEKGGKRYLTKEEIDDARNVKMEDLIHPEKDEDRAKNPEWLVMLGVCTHLGCVPLNDKGDYNGWFCPCHGSHYDTSGRIRKGPAPWNMEVPKYEFVDANTIKIG